MYIHICSKYMCIYICMHMKIYTHTIYIYTYLQQKTNYQKKSLYMYIYTYIFAIDLLKFKIVLFCSKIFPISSIVGLFGTFPECITEE